MSKKFDGILHLEDDPSDARLVQETLEEAGISCSITLVESEAEFNAALDESYDLILADYSLLGSDGLSALSIVRERLPDIPFILVSGKMGEETAIESIKSGASDYVLKQRLSRLVPSVRRALRESEVRAAVRLAEEELKKSEERYRRLVENLSDSHFLFVRNEAGDFIEISDSVLDVLGYTRDEFLSFVSAVFKDDWRNSDRKKGKVGPRRYERKVLHRDGKNRWFEISEVPVFDSAGNLLSIEGIATDTTDRKRLQQQILEAATREQERIGRDLHDSLGQQLTGIAFLTKRLSERLSLTEHKESENALRISELVNQAIYETGTLARGLSPVVTQPEGLPIAIAQLLEGIESLFEISCHFKCQDELTVREHIVATQLFRICQEAANNAVKHGKPDNLWIDLSSTKGRLRLAVADDGTGVSENIRESPGLGMRLMKYRAEIIGAELEIRPRLLEGTELICRLPVHPS